MLGHRRKRFKREEEERKNWIHLKGLFGLCMDKVASTSSRVVRVSSRLPTMVTRLTLE
jgi:hypothetical protein